MVEGARGEVSNVSGAMVTYRTTAQLQASVCTLHKLAPERPHPKPHALLVFELFALLR